jgi:hypothetical protein
MKMYETTRYGDKNGQLTWSADALEIQLISKDWIPEVTS